MNHLLYRTLLLGMLFFMLGAVPVFADVDLGPGQSTQPVTPTPGLVPGDSCTPGSNVTDGCSNGLVCEKTSGGTYACAVAPTPTAKPNPSTNPVTPPASNVVGTPAPGSNSGAGTPAPGSNSGGLTNPLGFSDIPGFLTAVLGLVVTIGGIVVVLMLVYIGFLFVTAQGAEEKIREAREALLWTIVGALVLLGAQAISIGIQATVGALGNSQSSGSSVQLNVSIPFKL